MASRHRQQIHDANGHVIAELCATKPLSEATKTALRHLAEAVRRHFATEARKDQPVTTPTGQQILDTPMADNDAGAATIRGYLIELLENVWTEREGFSGKRPFGNSSWEYDLYKALGDAGHIRYVKDEYGGCEDVDDKAGDRLIMTAIRSLATGEARNA